MIDTRAHRSSPSIELALPIRNGFDDARALWSSPSIDCRTSAVVDICLEHDLNRIGLYPYLAAVLRLIRF